MKIVVCIKPVKAKLVYPDEIRVEDYLMNPYDLYAFSKALEIGKKSDCEIICLSMGPVTSKDVLYKALAMGAHQAYLLNDNKFQGSDTVATSYILAKAIDKIGDVDLVVCGKQTIDGETGQITYAIAERLKFYPLSNIEEIVDVYDNKLVLKQVTENEEITGKVTPPCVVSFNDLYTSQPTISLLALKKAKNKELVIWGREELGADESRCGLDGSKTAVINVDKESTCKKKSYIQGTSQEKAKLIYELLTNSKGV